MIIFLCLIFCNFHVHLGYAETTYKCCWDINCSTPTPKISIKAVDENKALEDCIEKYFLAHTKHDLELLDNKFSAIHVRKARFFREDSLYFMDYQTLIKKNILNDFDSYNKLLKKHLMDACDISEKKIEEKLSKKEASENKKYVDRYLKKVPKLLKRSNPPSIDDQSIMQSPAMSFCKSDNPLIQKWVQDLIPKIDNDIKSFHRQFSKQPGEFFFVGNGMEMMYQVLGYVYSSKRMTPDLSKKLHFLPVSRNTLENSSNLNKYLMGENSPIKGLKFSAKNPLFLFDTFSRGRFTKDSSLNNLTTILRRQFYLASQKDNSDTEALINEAYHSIVPVGNCEDEELFFIIRKELEKNSSWTPDKELISRLERSGIDPINWKNDFYDPIAKHLTRFTKESYDESVDTFIKEHQVVKKLMDQYEEGKKILGPKLELTVGLSPLNPNFDRILGYTDAIAMNFSAGSFILTYDLYPKWNLTKDRKYAKFEKNMPVQTDSLNKYCQQNTSLAIIQFTIFQRKLNLCLQKIIKDYYSSSFLFDALK